MSLVIDALALAQIAQEMLRAFGDDDPAVPLSDRERRFMAYRRRQRVGVPQVWGKRTETDAAMVSLDVNDERNPGHRDAPAAIRPDAGMPFAIGPFLLPGSLAAFLSVCRMRSEVGGAPGELLVAMGRIVLRSLPLRHRLDGVRVGRAPGVSPLAVVDPALGSVAAHVRSVLAGLLGVPWHEHIVGDWLTYRPTLAA